MKALIRIFDFLPFIFVGLAIIFTLTNHFILYSFSLSLSFIGWGIYASLKLITRSEIPVWLGVKIPPNSPIALRILGWGVAVAIFLVGINRFFDTVSLIY